jgi:hypothetical protein
MAAFQHFKRRSIIPLAGVALVAYYFIVLAPLSRRAEGLNAPLQTAWQKLSNSLDQTNVTAIDFLHITNQLAETHHAMALLENAKQKLAARLELSGAVRAKMNQARFEYFDYGRDRSKQIDDTSILAKKCQVSIEPAVFTGFPEYTSEMKQPVFLWAALSLLDSLLTTALECRVSVIHSLEVPVVLTNEPPASTAAPPIEIPFQIEMTGSAASLLKLLQSLPLRADEMRAAGLTEGLTNKAPLFIERLIMKKQTPDKPDEVRVSLRAVGFVLRE